MTLIKDLIDIPERIHKGDFVLRLTEGVERAQETLHNYVVTPQLRDNFDHTLDFIKSALDHHSSKAAYLHGSFGSGKSHFMAVLHLLLQHHPDARAIPELAPVVAKHAGWLNDKKLLLVPYHMIGALSMESAILGGYVNHMRKHHPEAAMPGVYLAEGLFRDAKNMRRQVGDERFFAMLNGNRQADDADDWGELSAQWQPQRFEEAMQQPVGGPLRSRLVGDLVARIFTAHVGMAATREESFVPLEEGLAIISRHAQERGFDGLILFLDELILWLASHVANLTFVGREIQKVIKLVESSSGQRPVPIISLVARQRDLRELVGEHIPGVQQLSFTDTLKYWEGRFETITLEDRNLPIIVEKRVLRPRSDAARAALQTSFETSTKVREDVWSTLLTHKGDREMFRRVYPFTPALVQALVALSSVLQRERTALKVMIQLLVNQRDTLELGQFVPVGDLYDIIADEAEPFTSEMRHHFDNARRLYQDKLLPMLARELGLRTDRVLELPEGDPKRRAFLIDDRLLKTLLLAALVPEVECFKGLTTSRLTHLNYGTVRSPIPGLEVSTVLQKCRKWAGQVGEIKIGEEATNPTIALQLSGVDTETILEKARAVDSVGSRTKKIRELLVQSLGITDTSALFGEEHTFLWRGTPRTVDLLFARIREMTDDLLKSSEARWKVIIDFPFDSEGYAPSDGQAVLERFRTRSTATHTFCWLPALFSREVQTDLGTLVVMDHLLASDDRFRGYTDHLSDVERATARNLMDNQRSQLRQHVRNCLEMAYGIAQPAPGILDGAHNLADHFYSLDPTFQPRPPVGANLGEGFLHLVDQALSHQYPAHPRFDTEIKPAGLRLVLEELKRAMQTSDGRSPVEKPRRATMVQIANPLRLGQMHETHFVLDNHWPSHFERQAASDGGPLTVGKLRAWTDEPQAMGLPILVQNLLIQFFAERTNRIFLQQGGPIEPPLENMPDGAVLQQQLLPDPTRWESAVKRAGTIFGMTASPLCNAPNLVKLVQEIQTLIPNHLESCHQLAKALRERGLALGLPSETPRQQSAAGVLLLLERLKQADPHGVIMILATWTHPATDSTLGTSLKQASLVWEVLKNITTWDLLTAAWSLDDHRQERAMANREKVLDALTRDELVIPLGPVLKTATGEAIRLLAPASTTPPVTPPAVTTPPPRGRKIFSILSRRGLGSLEARKVLEEIHRQLDAHPEAEMTIGVRLEGQEEAS